MSESGALDPPRDLLVDTPSPEALDRTLQQMGAVLVGGGTPLGYERVGEHYVVRCLGNPGFIRFAIESQGYAKVIGWRDEQ